MAKAKTTLDQLPSIHDIVRKHIEDTGSHYGYSLTDFDRIYSSFSNEGHKEDFLQDLYDALPKEIAE